MTCPHVSVVIPAYNAVGTLSRAVESVFAQTYGDWELIIVDDGSTDGTADVARAYGGRIRLVSTPHVGPGDARNHGAAVARGEFLAWLDADDVWYPSKLDRQVALAASDEEIDLVSGNYHYIDENGRQDGTGFQKNEWLMWRLAQANTWDQIVFTREDVPSFIRHGFGATITMMLKRSLFERVAGFSGAFHVAEDVHLVMRAVAASRKFAAVCEPVAAYYRRTGSAVRTDVEKSQRETIRAYRDLRRWLRPCDRAVRRAVAEPLSRAYLDHSAILARQGRRWDGFRAACRSWLTRPDKAALSAMLAMARGSMT